jgi:phage shock protein A
MALINRISRLFKADFHAVLDQIEEPETLLKQAVRDMEDDLASTAQRIKLCAHDQDALQHRKAELEGSVAEIGSQLDLCFDSGKDDLAKSLVRKKLEAERLLKRLTTELFAQRASLQTNASSEFADVAWMAREMTVDDNEVEIPFLREKDLRSAS